MIVYIILAVYLVTISLIAVALTIHDKNAARKSNRRIRESTLFTVSLFGGSVAMFFTMLSVRHKTRRTRFMAGLPLIILFQVVIVILAFNQSLSISYINLNSDKISNQIRIALVTDLHSCKYGEKQKQLIDAIENESPDLIFLCGDIYDDVLPPDNTTEFIGAISTKYQCFYVSGNHEFWSGKADSFKDLLISYGVTVLEGTTASLEIRGDIINITGIDDPDTDKYTSRSIPYADQVEHLYKAADREVFTVLLSHRPERINELLPLKPDLVTAGHAHGGQWRIPWILPNGLIAPDQWLFPKYTNGAYNFEDTTMVVSRGLARKSTVIPRIYNRPEIVIITIG